MKKLILLPLIVLYLTGCGIYKDVKVAKRIAWVDMGMTQTEVEKAIGVKYNSNRDKYLVDRYGTKWGIGSGLRGRNYKKAYFFEFDTLGELSNWGWHTKDKRWWWW
jgi:hypothetical protein